MSGYDMGGVPNLDANSMALYRKQGELMEASAALQHEQAKAQLAQVKFALENSPTKGVSVRMQCVQLAVGVTTHRNGQDVLDLAYAFEQFITGGKKQTLQVTGTKQTLRTDDPDLSDNAG